MIDPQREKEFLFELERICHNFNLIIEAENETIVLGLLEVDYGNIDQTTEFIEDFIDELRTDR